MTIFKQKQSGYSNLAIIVVVLVVAVAIGLATSNGLLKKQETTKLDKYSVNTIGDIVGLKTKRALNERARGAMPAIPAVPSPGKGIPATPAVPAIPPTTTQQGAKGFFTIDWVRQFGTELEDYANAVAVDLSGNVYVTGGYHQLFLAKYDNAGNQLWLKWSSDYSTGNAIVTDKLSNIYVLAGDSLIKYDNLGNQIWSRQFKGNIGWGVRTDSSANVYVVGRTWGDNFLGRPLLGLADAFVIKYDSSGEQIWAKQFGTAGAAVDGEAIALDSSGNIYITGSITGEPFPGQTTLVDDYRDFVGYMVADEDVFIAKFNNLGNPLWVRQFGGNDLDIGYGIVVDSSGNAYITGTMGGDVVLWYTITPAVNDLFVAKYDSLGNQIWLKQSGTKDYDIGYGIAIDSLGDLYVTGDIFKEPPEDLLTSCITHDDAFVAKYNNLGEQLAFKEFGIDKLGGKYYYSCGWGMGIAVDASGNTYIAGNIQDGAFWSQNLIGWVDAFVAKLSSSK